MRDTVNALASLIETKPNERQGACSSLSA